MKLLYLCEFSAGVDGVWNRVYNIAKQLAKRHEVFTFSSNIEKGSGKKVVPFEERNGIKIYRFPVSFRLGENALFWNYESKLREIKPDIVHAHVFRHPHSTSAPAAAKKVGARAFLTTHAPFVEHELRSFLLNFAVSLYDAVLAKKTLNSYEKVIAIAKWEIPELRALGCKNEKIVYIPNGFPSEFIKQKPKFSEKKEKTVLFLGRIAPVKNIELLLRAFKKVVVKDHRVKLKLIGQMEEGYGSVILPLIKRLDLSKHVELPGPVYDLKRKISLIDNSDIFVLPSKREASPQALIEAMAREKTIISSDNPGSRDIISDGKNGFLFNSEEELSDKLEYVLKNFGKLKNLSTKARKDVSQLTWENLAAKEEQLYRIK